MYTPTEKGAVKGFIPELGITTLEEYYNWLPDLKRDADGKPTKYTMLPLDEPHFEINANTRAINIPNDFKKNGIAVQGDDLAEVVYFKVDRYFDAMDFNNTTIYIEWEAPKDKSGVVVKGVSDIYIKDIESEPGKLIFGWAISDAITKNSGALKFAVRFLTWNEGNEGANRTISYSFSTLTAQVTIQPGLALDLENENIPFDNCNDRLLERIQPGEVVGGVKAAIPYFLQNLTLLDDGYDIEDNHTDGTYTLYAVATSDDTGAISYVWKRADLNEDNMPDDAWYEITEDVKFEMVPVDLKACDYKLTEGHIYHLANGDGTYKVYDKSYNLEDVYFKDSMPEVFEQKASLKVEKYGQYKVEARNRIFNSLTKKDSNIAVFKRPAHIIMDNSKQTVTKHIVGEASATLTPEFAASKGDLVYQWYRADEINPLSHQLGFGALPVDTKVSYGVDTARIMIPKTTEFKGQNVGTGGNKNCYYIEMRRYAPEGAVSFREASVGLNPSTLMPTDDTLEEMRLIAEAPHGVDAEGRVYRSNWYPVAQFDATTNTWTYYAKTKGEGEFIGWKERIVWYDEDGNVLEDNFCKLQLANEINYSDLNNYEVVNEAGAELEYTATEPGLYKLHITRIRNRATTEAESIEYRVTNAPAVPVFNEDTFTGEKSFFITELEDKKSEFVIGWENDIESDEFIITWKMYREMAGKEDLTIAVQKVRNVYSASFNPANEMYKTIIEAAGEDLEARYYATIQNKLNDVTSAVTEVPAPTNMFYVTD